MNGGFRWIKRTTAGVTLAAVAVVGTGTAALAHECFNASRPARAEAKAASSQGWTWASEIILRFVIPEILSDPDGLSPEELAAALAIVEEERAAGVEVYADDRALLDHSTAMNGNSRDGFGPKSDDERAIEHATADLSEFDALVGHLIGIYFAVSS